MPKKMDKYRDDYIRESKEHVDGLNQALLLLEKSPKDKSVINSLFRHAHTLKSMSAAMGFHATEKLCHALEDLLEKIKQETVQVDTCIDLLFSTCDLVSNTILGLEGGEEERDTDQLIRSLRSIVKNSNPSDEKAANPGPVEHQNIEKIRSINVKVDRLDKLMSLSEEFLINRMQLGVLQDKLNNRELSLSVKNLDRLINELQYLVKQARLVPLGYVFNRFPRMVRDLAKAEQKEIDLQIQGSSIELDRAIIDELAECLVHLLRNAIDHGIESKEKRLKAKKFKLATVTINAYRSEDKMIIEVSDDGSGLPIETIRKKAKAMKILPSHATEEQVIDTIFSDLSTSNTVSSLSGRGVGLSIVKRKMESLGGRVSVKTEPNKGTTFSLELSLT